MTEPNDGSRRRFLLTTVVGGLGAAGALVVSSCSSGTRQPATSTLAASPTPGSPPPQSGSVPAPAPLAANADEALRLLTDGNQRYVENRAQHVDDDANRRIAVRSSQVPFATILSCVDSRVPVELVFDRGLGDLVVIRSAGEVLDRSVIGSLEFGVAELNTPLLMVLGHQRCGALTAAAKAYDKKSVDQGDLAYLEQALAPAVVEADGQPGDRITNAVRANVGQVLGQLRGSPLIGPLEKQGKIKLIGAYYSLDTGHVDLL